MRWRDPSGRIWGLGVCVSADGWHSAADLEDGAIQREAADESDAQDVEQTIDDVVSNNSTDSDLVRPSEVRLLATYCFWYINYSYINFLL